MLLLLSCYPNKPRECKKFIMGLVKSGMAARVQKIQYVKAYYMEEDTLKQGEEKILLITLPEKNKDKIIAFFAKNHPNKTPDMLWLKPEEVNEAYLQWVTKHTK